MRAASSIVSGSLGMRRGLLVGALGVVYGDIGTSPIYTFRESVKAAGGQTDPDVILGVVSLIFWALMIVVSLKYVLVVMRADHQGEGGIIVLLGLAAHSEPDRNRRNAILLLGLVGAALFYGDGMITPAISVLSAVEGLFRPSAGLPAPFFAIEPCEDAFAREQATSA